ncbi:hypothetical protein FRC20_009803 [Serendipita sp. 405]|nr:hypothetical protein FRC20_009803 [Serendipita sp. 405]
MNTHGAMYAPQQMAPAAFYSAQNKGTLQPGQVIQIQSITVTVERFLSQGGFAHVYLVRSAAPVNGTIHHVLKRMLVADHVMLQDVKKEVDIMRILKGHSNIVTLIDSAWNPLPDGRFEVFILMEFCAGGGIIDMMNRRLRERLTEGEILQIFVDVCEGVAAMHHLKPPLLHRDLKVENILQANETSYKLCDFGSASTVSKPPTTVAEMRSLESDLNRHTTLQYRAPEMVDPHLRRPIDEKSDVWALGVLLYKLCYYTTPFEEHGPLAILNVQYRIPPYPVYSQNMIALITRILREYGTQRPTIFEILDTVHRMRGTKSRFRYAPPPPAVTSAIPRSPDNIVSYRTAPQPKDSASAAPVAAPTQAPQAAMESIAPMRRGRPNAAPVGIGMYNDDLDLPTPRGGHFKSMTTNERWGSSAREAPAVLGSSARPSHLKGPSQEWIPGKQTKDDSRHQGSPWDGLGSLNPSEKGFSNGFGDAFDPTLAAARRNLQNVSNVQSPPATSSSASPGNIPLQHSPAPPQANTVQPSRFTMPTPSRLLQAPRPPMQTKPRDSYDEFTAPSTSAPSASMIRPSSNASNNNGLVSAFSRPSTAADSVASTGTGLSSTAVVEGSVALSAAERFPSIEHLEMMGRGAGVPAAPIGPRAPSPVKPSLNMQHRPPAYAGLSRMGFAGGFALDHDLLTSPPSVPISGVRSQQVTGTAMKGSGIVAPAGPSAGTAPKAPMSTQLPPFAITNRFPQVERPPSRFLTAERPTAPGRKPLLARRRQESMEVKMENAPQQKPQPEQDLLGQHLQPSTQPLMTQRTPSPSAVPQRDWLMEDDVILNTIPKAATGTIPPRLPTPDTGAFGETQTGADSSGNEEEPEEAGITSLHKMRMRGRNQITDSSSFSERMQDVTPRQHQGRQGSVHDLVDIRSTASSNKSNQDANAWTNHQKVPSRDLMSFSDAPGTQTNTQAAYEIAAHRFPSIDALDRRPSPSSASGSEKDTDAPRPNLPQKRHSASRGRPAHQLLDRNRPQSLFIPATLGSGHVLGARNSPPESLSVPNAAGNANAVNRQSSPRRGSIGDMVSRFEAMSVVSSVSGYAGSTESGPTSPKQKPPVALKPASLRPGNVPPSAFSSPITHRFPVLKSPVASLASSSNSGAFFPPVESSGLQQQTQRDTKMNAPMKMRTSPLLFKSMESPTESILPSQSTYSRERESPIDSRGSGVGSGYGGSSQTSGLQAPYLIEKDRRSSPGSQSGAISDTNEDILVSPRPRQIPPQAINEYHSSFTSSSQQQKQQQQQQQYQQQQQVPPQSQHVHLQQQQQQQQQLRGRTPPPPSESPEQSYGGVGRLIDQWQKKTEEAEGKGRVGARPGGPRQQRKQDNLSGRSAGGGST